MLWAALMCALTAIDGDTLRCGTERIRLVGIDAPELPGHCRRGRQCVAGDAEASKRSLARVLHGRAEIQRLGHDRYGRTIAAVRVNGRDLSCHQLRAGGVAYIPRWDSFHVAEHACPREAARAEVNLLPP